MQEQLKAKQENHLGEKEQMGLTAKAMDPKALVLLVCMV